MLVHVEATQLVLIAPSTVSAMPRRHEKTSTQSTDQSTERAHEVLQALVEVVSEAQKRGLPLSEAYVHFDQRDEGVVSVDSLMQAVVELRLCPSSELWDEQDAEACVDVLSRGKSRVYFTREDFVRYFSAAASSNPVRERDVPRGKSKSKHPDRHVRFQKTSPEKRNHLQYWQEQAAATIHTLASSPQKKTPLRVTLPEWAHARSKRALKELEERRRKRSKSQPPLTLSSTPNFDSASPLSELTPDSYSNNEVLHDDDNNEPTETSTAVPQFDLIKKTQSTKADENPDDSVVFTLSDKWKTFQVDTDTIISYGILSHDTVLSSPSKNNTKASTPTAWAPPSQSSVEITAEEEASGLPNMTEFRLTIFLDIFQRLETLEAFFYPLLVHFPRGKILLCGFPTRSKRSAAWHNARFAGVYSKLLEHVMTQSREWLVQPKMGIGAVPQYLVGFGTGGSTALQLLGMELPMRLIKGDGGGVLGLFTRSLRGLVLVNTLASVTEVERRTIRPLQKLLDARANAQPGVTSSRSDVVELHEALASMLFSEHYLTQVAPSRTAALETFFCTRRGFLQTLETSAPEKVGKAYDTVINDNAKIGQLLRVLLRGSTKNRDVTAAIANLAAVVPAPFALIVVHGSQNALFTPQQVELITGNNGAPPSGFSLVKTISEAISLSSVSDFSISDARCMHVAWLKGGHELLQERGSFFYDLFRQLATAAVVYPQPENTHDEQVQSTVTSGETHRSSTSQNPRSTRAMPPRSNSGVNQYEALLLNHEEISSPLTHPQSPKSHSKLRERVTEQLSMRGLPWIQQELYDRGIEGAGPTDIILERYQGVLAQEEKVARRQERDKQRIQAKHAKIEAQRKSKEEEARDRELQAIEARRSIQRRERESQQQFFEQMEAKKLENVRRLQENENMALEDLLSRKVEDLLISDLERRTRNDVVVRQMGELEAERQEQVRHESQIELQALRLEEQKAQREALKAFQREFEQKELVSSPVEAYVLDAPAVYERFEDITNGARVLAVDLSHFYEIKALQIRESGEARLELETLLQGPLAADELQVRNLERVQAKAQNTGMIAKAGMGTVRIVPITPAEMQALGRDLDIARDELERIQNDVSLRRKDLAWKDQLLQRLSVIIQRNERFREEVLAKLALCADLGNERVLSLREDNEALEFKRDGLIELRDKLKRRQAAVQGECERARAATTTFFDTNLRVVGALQRVQRTIIIRELETEDEALSVRVVALDEQDKRVRHELKRSIAMMEEVATRTFALEESQRLLRGTTEVKDLSIDNSNKDDSALSSKNKMANGTKTQHDIAENVRLKKHVDRSAEEKRWVTLDFLTNFAHYYKHIAPEEVEIIQKSVDYQQKSEKKLTVENLQRLMQLPARNCLAFAFFKSPEEMEAHYLLRKYTFGDGEEYFAQLDHEFEIPNGVAAPQANLSFCLEDLLVALQRIADSSPSLARRCPRARVALLDDKMPPLTLLHVPQTQILPHKSTTHSFQLPRDSEGVAVLSLTVSVVFQGHFKSVGYQNGRLAAMMYMLPPVTDPNSLQQRFQAPVPIGKCFYAEDLALCSPHSMGRIVLRHEPHSIPLSAAATYQIVLGAPVFTAYSLEVRGRTALFADEALRRKRVDALKKQDLLPRQHDELQNVFLTIQLSERKKRLAHKLATEAKDQSRTAELELLRNNQKLERDNAEPLLSHEERRDLHTVIRSANTTFTHCCFLFSKREEEVRDIEQSLRELTKIHVDVLEDCEKMEQLLSEYRTYLPQIAALLSGERDLGKGDAAAAILASELNVEYVSKNGTKSSKVRWAELSAMKAKLPSMMTPAERLRRKYKKGRDTLDKKEREWVLLDRVLHPRLYRWEEDRHGGAADGGYTNAPGVKLRLHGAYPKLSKDEEQLAALSQLEIERIMKAPWNLLERKEILIRKVLTRFRDDHGGNSKRIGNSHGSTMSMVTLLRAQKSTELTLEEREWRLYDQLLNPMYYPVNFKRLAKEIAGAVSGGLEEVTISPKITREDLVMAIDTPEEELYKLPSDLLRGRTLLLKYDPQLTINLINAARIQQVSQNSQTTNAVEVDVDARCRLVYLELQRAIANTRNEFMDSNVLHSTLQRFPTKVLRLELEKDLDRLLISQIKEKEDFELANFLAKKKAPDNTGDTISDSDSDEEAVIAREVEARRKAKEDAKQGPKVRGKALKQKSLQKQRREIKNALQGHSLEEQRMILREQELGVGGCTACWTNPCHWKPFLEESCMTIQERIDVIREELERVKHCRDLMIASSICMAAVKSGNQTVTLRKSDLFDELTLEAKLWEKNLRLKAVDEELHETFRSKNEFFETQALHGFRQIQHKNKVQVALQREHNVLVAHLTAYEVVEDVLESMLEGWIFGERESERQVLGYVPSLKREGPLTMQDLRRFEQDRRILQVRQDIREEQLQNAQGLPSDKWKPIEVEAFQVNLTKKAVQKGSEMDKSLTETENALKFGLFCMTLMYFRGLSLLKRQKTVWSVSAAKRCAAAEPSKSAERRRMDTEKRNVELRARKAALYEEKARVGQARKQKFHEQKLEAYRKRLVDENRKANRERKAAINIQRMYRGHVGKIAGIKWMLRRREIDAQRALDHAAAITLQRAYRGRLGRIAAEDQRVELAEFISQIRAEEAIDEEEEYWNNHKVERMARKVVAFVKKQA